MLSGHECEWPAVGLGFVLRPVAFGAWMVPVHGGLGWVLASFGTLGLGFGFEHEKGIWWMPWRQEAMKDVARCEKPGGAASRL